MIELSTGLFRGSSGLHNPRMTESAPPSQVGRFLTIADAAELLAIPAAQAFDLIRSGEIPAIRLNTRGGWRIERTELESYIDAKYEEARRIGLWEQARFDPLPEIGGGRILPPSGTDGRSGYGGLRPV